MPRTVTKRLTAQAVKTLGIGRHGDGDGLYLLVRKPKKAGGELGRFWIFRWTQDGREREAGLGPGAACRRSRWRMCVAAAAMVARRPGP
jgi:hypothetical protein